MEAIWISIACAEGAVILALGGLIAKAIFRMADSVNKLTVALADFVKKDDCKEDMGEHCTKMDSIEKRVEKFEKDFVALKAQSEIWHKEDM